MRTQKWETMKNHAEMRASFHQIREMILFYLTRCRKGQAKEKRGEGNLISKRVKTNQNKIRKKEIHSQKPKVLQRKGWIEKRKTNCTRCWWCAAMAACSLDSSPTPGFFLLLLLIWSRFVYIYTLLAKTTAEKKRGSASCGTRFHFLVTLVQPMRARFGWKQPNIKTKKKEAAVVKLRALIGSLVQCRLLEGNLFIFMFARLWLQVDGNPITLYFFWLRE